MICTTVGKYCLSLLSVAIIIDNMNKSTFGRIFFGLEVIDQNHGKVSQTFKCGKRRQGVNQRDSAYLLSLKRLLSLLNDTSYEHWSHVGHPPQTCPVDLPTSQSGGGVSHWRFFFSFGDSSLNQ